MYVKLGPSGNYASPTVEGLPARRCHMPGFSHAAQFHLTRRLRTLSHKRAEGSGKSNATCAHVVVPFFQRARSSDQSPSRAASPNQMLTHAARAAASQLNCKLNFSYSVLCGRAATLAAARAACVSTWLSERQWARQRLANPIQKILDRPWGLTTLRQQRSATFTHFTSTRTKSIAYNFQKSSPIISKFPKNLQINSKLVEKGMD